MAWFLVSTKAPGLKFRVVKLDKQTMRAVLRGATGSEFERDISQETLDKLGYQIVQIDEQEAAQ